jgi:hypothetical protein
MAERDPSAFNAMLTRLRTGILWDALPGGFGSMPTIRSPQAGWWNAGKWPRLIAILPGDRVTTPFPLDAAVSPFRLSGDVTEAVLYAGTERESDPRHQGGRPILYNVRPPCAELKRRRCR